MCATLLPDVGIRAYHLNSIIIYYKRKCCLQVIQLIKFYLTLTSQLIQLEQTLFRQVCAYFKFLGVISLLFQFVYQTFSINKIIPSSSLRLKMLVMYFRIEKLAMDWTWNILTPHPLLSRQVQLYSQDLGLLNLCLQKASGSRLGT